MTEEDKINWLVPGGFPVLRPREIHLWCAWLGTDGGPGPEELGCLSPAEIARARSFHFAVDRQRFAVARRNLRHVLARYLGREPAALAFNCGRFGKPMLIHQATTISQLDPAASNLTFNQSHCGSLWLLAVAWNQPVGVDLEQVRDLSDLYLLEGKIFSAAELPRQCSLPHPERRLAFFRRWTQREASAKFHGLGFDPSTTYVQPDNLELLSPATHYVGTLAYGGSPVHLHQFQWSDSLLHPPAPATVNTPSGLLSSPDRRMPVAAVN